MPTVRPTIYLIAGCNGAGKITFAKEFLPSVGALRFLSAMGNLGQPHLSHSLPAVAGNGSLLPLLMT